MPKLGVFSKRHCPQPAVELYQSVPRRNNRKVHIPISPFFLVFVSQTGKRTLLLGSLPLLPGYDSIREM